MAMSSYLSNLLTQTTSKYNTLRRTLLSSEEDGDTEDDTHVCRVLRAYYTEKGRPFPGWLPPDPNDRKVVTPQLYSNQSGYFGSNVGKTPYGSQPSLSNQRANLSDLWDPPSAQSQTPPMGPSSLRNARRPGNTSQATSTSSIAPAQARPLPSQRAGSHQVSYMSAAATQRPPAEPSLPSTSSVGSGTAQDRLKARLWGGRTNSSSPTPGQVGASDPYEQSYSNPPSWSSQGNNPYDAGGGGGGGGNRRYGRAG